MLTLKEKNSKAVIVCFGRFQPPTIGHLEQVKFMAKEADARGVEARLYTSHTNDTKKNPLTYEQKVKWLKKAFGHLVDVKESPARTIIEVLAELYKEGFTEVYYTGGSDREGVGDLVLQYNGKPDKSGNIVYSFDVLEPLVSGQRVEGISGTDVRNFVKNGDFESFEKLVPFDEVDAQELFYEIRDGLGIKEGRNMKINNLVKNLNEAEETNFNKKRDFSKVDSLAMAYNLLKDELRASPEYEKILPQVEAAIEDIERITNSIDISLINKLSDKLEEAQTGLSPAQFIKIFDPTETDLNIILKDNYLVKDGGLTKSKINLTDYNLTPNFLDALIDFKGGNKSSSTVIGKYEFLMAILFKGGSMQISGDSTAGDVSINGKNIEVKNIQAPAAIGYDIGYPSELIKDFDDFIFMNLDDPNRVAKTRTRIRNITYTTQINKEDLPHSIKSLEGVGETGTISFSDLFNTVFKKIISIYSERFDYLALCKDKDIYVLDADGNLADYLIKNFRISLEDYMGKRLFKIQG